MKGEFTPEWADQQIERARAGWGRGRPAPDRRGGSGHVDIALPEREYDNKWEATYAFNLELQKRAGLILDYGYHRLKFRIAKRTWYTPDFDVVTTEGWQVHEVKGFMRDDAAVKIKTCAEMFRFLRWFLVRKEGEGWEIQVVGR